MAETVIGGAGCPLPPLLKPMDDARWWAEYANPKELKAYCLAAFEAMQPRDRRAFLAHVSGRGAA